MSTLILCCRSPDVDAYRALLERDLLQGRLLVPSGDTTPELHESVLVRLEVGREGFTLEAEVVAPCVRVGDATMVGVVFPVDATRALALRALAGAASPTAETSGSPGEGGSFAPSPTGPWPSSGAASGRDTSPEGERVANANGSGERPQTRVRRGVVDAVTFIPHHQDSGFGAPPPSASRWPEGLPSVDRLVAARNGQLDPADRAGVIHALDAFVASALLRAPRLVLGLPEDPDEASIHRAFQRLTAALGARDPDPLLSPDLADRLQRVIDTLVRNRDIALVHAARPGRRLERSAQRR